MFLGATCGARMHSLVRHCRVLLKSLRWHLHRATRRKKKAGRPGASAVSPQSSIRVAGGTVETHGSGKTSRRDSELRRRIAALLQPLNYMRYERSSRNWIIRHSDLHTTETKGWELAVAKDSSGVFGYTFFARHLEAAIGSDDLCRHQHLQFKLGKMIISVSAMAEATNQLSCLMPSEATQLQETIASVSGYLEPFILAMSKRDLSKDETEMLQAIDGIWATRSIGKYVFHQFSEVPTNSKELRTLKEYGFTVHRMMVNECKPTSKYIIRTSSSSVNLLFCRTSNYETVVKRCTGKGISVLGGAGEEIRTSNLNMEQVNHLVSALFEMSSKARDETKPMQVPAIAAHMPSVAVPFGAGDGIFKHHCLLPPHPIKTKGANQMSLTGPAPAPRGDNDCPNVLTGDDNTILAFMNAHYGPKKPEELTS